MSKFKIGDTVTLKAEQNTLYIVASSYKGKRGVNDIGDVTESPYYELIRILPIPKKEEKPTHVLKDEEHVVLYARYQCRMWELMIEFIKNDRKKSNQFGEPDFLAIVEAKRNGGVATFQKSLIHRTDTIRYVYDTVDDCLEALSDLNLLIGMFESEPEAVKEYKKEKKKVIKQLKKLTS